MEKCFCFSFFPSFLVLFLPFYCVHLFYFLVCYPLLFSLSSLYQKSALHTLIYVDFRADEKQTFRNRGKITFSQIVQLIRYR